LDQAIAGGCHAPRSGKSIEVHEVGGIMDRRTLLGRLAKAEKHAAGSTERITKQQSIVARLQDKGQDTRQALALLNAYRKMQALSEANLRRLRGEIGQAE
jgi:hypothetical protein